MSLAPWFVLGTCILVCAAVVIGAKQFWVKGFGVLVGLLLLPGFLSAFMRDSAAVTFTFVIALFLIAGFIWRRRRKSKKKDDDDRRGGTTINITR